MGKSDEMSLAKPMGMDLAGKQRVAVTEPFVCFVLGGDVYALALENVSRVVRMVRITPVPDPPPWIAGVIDIQGRVVPVLRLAERFGYPARPLDINGRLLVARAGGREIALMVDEVIGIAQVGPSQRERPAEPRPGGHPLKAVLHTDTGLVMELDAGRLMPGADPGLAPGWDRD